MGALRLGPGRRLSRSAFMEIPAGSLLCNRNVGTPASNLGGDGGQNRRLLLLPREKNRDWQSGDKREQQPARPELLFASHRRCFPMISGLIQTKTTPPRDTPALFRPSADFSECLGVRATLASSSIENTSL